MLVVSQSDRKARRSMNSLISQHLPETYFPEYQALRPQLLAILTDGDLAVRVGGATESIGELCRGIGEVERSYIDSFRTFRQDFDYRNPDPRLSRSVAALTDWYAELDAELMATLEALTEDDIANRRILRGVPGPDEFSLPPAQQLDIYREALLIFYAKVSVYLRAMDRPLPGDWGEWLG
jgi:uncharacterized damage-inducible protein DinB